MRLPRCPHPWRLSPARAVHLQRQLAARIQIEHLPTMPRRVAGLDCSLSLDGQWCLAAAVVWDCTARAVVEVQVARTRFHFPYVPGLLSFREAPALLLALRRLRTAPDVLMCDGHGLAHPRRFGIACHLGLVTGLPSLGCAKSPLVPSESSLADGRGSSRPVRLAGDTVGTVLRTRDAVAPVYVSPGHRVSVKDAVAIVLRCCEGRRLPEPTRLADRRVGEERRTFRPPRAVPAAS